MEVLASSILARRSGTPTSRLEYYFVANGISDSAKKRAVLPKPPRSWDLQTDLQLSGTGKTNSMLFWATEGTCSEPSQLEIVCDHGASPLQHLHSTTGRKHSRTCILIATSHTELRPWRLSPGHCLQQTSLRSEWPTATAPPTRRKFTYIWYGVEANYSLEICQKECKWPSGRHFALLHSAVA